MLLCIVVFFLLACPLFGPSNLNNGRVEGSGSVYRSTYRFMCNDGYVLVGNDVVTCIENGTWNGTKPRCLKGKKLVPLYWRGFLKASTPKVCLTQMTCITCHSHTVTWLTNIKGKMSVISNSLKVESYFSINGNLK